jgi:glycosyltransferase involved in cell wall biosynthesis
MLEPGQRYVATSNPELLDGIKVFRFGYVGDRLAWRKLFISPGMISFLKHHVGDFDVVHLQELISVQAVATRKYCRKQNVPYVLSVRGSMVLFDGSSPLMQAYLRTFGRRIIMDSARVIALTHKESTQYESVGVKPGRVAILPNGVPVLDYENLPKSGDFRKRFGIEPKERIILFLGRIHRMKDIDNLVEAFALMSRDIENARLVIAGPDDGVLGSLRRQVNGLGITAKVLFTGPVYSDMKLAAYVDSDVSVLPSRYEAFGTTVLESLACGTPVIVTKGCGLADVASRAGIVVDGDPASIRDALVKMLNREDLRVQLANEGLRIVRNEFDWRILTPRLEGVYEECAHARLMNGKRLT